MSDGRCPHCKRKFNEPVQEEAPRHEEPKSKSKYALFGLVLLVVFVGATWWIKNSQQRAEKAEAARYVQSLDKFAGAFSDLQSIPDNYRAFENKIRKAWDELLQAGIPKNKEEANSLTFEATDILMNITKALSTLVHDIRDMKFQEEIDKFDRKIDSIPKEQIDERIKVIEEKTALTKAMNTQLGLEIKTATMEMGRIPAIDSYLTDVSRLIRESRINIDEHDWQGIIASYGQRIQTWLAKRERLLDRYESIR